MNFFLHFISLIVLLHLVYTDTDTNCALTYNNQCLYCVANYILNPEATRCVYCNKKNKCIKCVRYRSECSVCIDGYFNFKFGCRKCTQKPKDYCKCAVDDICMQCDNGYTLQGGLCLLCGNAITNCLSCKTTKKACTNCRSPLFISKNKQYCNYLEEKVYKCDVMKGDICTKCKLHKAQSGFYLDSTNNILRCKACYLIRDIKFENRCICADQDGNCKICTKGHAINEEKSCTICHEIVKDCKFCHSYTNKCDICDKSLHLTKDGRKCLLKCDNPEIPCKICYDNTCTQCQNGFYSNGQTCFPCMPKCVRCINDSFCYECEEYYHVAKNYNGCTRCNSNLSNCRKCNIEICLICKPGFTLFDGRCKVSCENIFKSNIICQYCLSLGRSCLMNLYGFIALSVILSIFLMSAMLSNFETMPYTILLNSEGKPVIYINNEDLVRLPFYNN